MIAMITLKELSITEARARKLFQLLDGSNTSQSRTQRVAMVTQAAREAGVIDKRKNCTRKFSVSDIAADFVDAYADFSLLKQFFLPSYARDTRLDSYGKIDERKFHVSVLKILKREGVVENSSYGFYAPLKSELIALFCKLKTEAAEHQILTPYDRGLAYEARVATALEAIAQNICMTQGGTDFGADLTFSYAGKMFVAQCKAHQKVVGVKAVQEVATAIPHYAAEFGVVFSESGFSDQALRLADSNKILMIDGTNIEAFERQARLLRFT